MRRACHATGAGLTESFVGRAEEDPTQRESRDADQARTPQSGLVSEIRAEVAMGRKVMAPTQVGALDTILGTADAPPATQGDGVVVGDGSLLWRMYAMMSLARAK